MGASVCFFGEGSLCAGEEDGVGIIGDAARAQEVLERVFSEPAKILARGLVAVAAAYSERAHEPLVSVRASGDAGHEDGCFRDHVVPGVCVPAGEEVRHAG